MELPQPPTDQELRHIIDKLAKFVARNGPEFEHMTKTKQKNNPKFSFLFGGEHYHYYTYKVNAEQAILRQKGHPPPNVQQQPPFFSHPPPNINPGWRGPGPSSFRGGGSSHFSGRPPPSPRMSGPPPPAPAPALHQGPNKPRPLMDIPTYAPDPNAAVEMTEDVLEDEVKETQMELDNLKEQIHQSEQNLAAQKIVTDDQVKEITEATIRKSRLEHLELLATDTGIELSDIDTMLQPIIESCTKDTIGSGKVWIFQCATSHDRNRLLARYLAYKVTEPEASFQLKLHLIYLMNDVVHHCVRKNNDDLKGSLESVAVEMFCSAWLSCATGDDPPSREGKLTKLIRLWQDKSIFSQVTLRRMREVEETWTACQEQLELDYEQPIKAATMQLVETYQNYSGQHNAFVTHAENSINTFETKFQELQAKVQKPQVPAADPPAKKGSRGSRWDTGSDGQSMPHQTVPPSSVVLPDLSRPPPGFGGGPPGHQHQHIPPRQQPPFQETNFSKKETNLVPTLPYYDLPAGLIVPLIKMDDSGYKPLNPKDLRLPPPSPPTDRLLAALDQFYAPPSHDRPRDPEGWEMLGLYEWSRAKTAAIKKKADDIEDGRRDRSLTASPEPFADDLDDLPPKPTQERAPPYRSRSRTRSRSRESTPDDHRGRCRRSLSPEGSYALPSYLTKRSPSPDRGSPPSHRREKQRPATRRSPTPPEAAFTGFGGSKQLDASNKGHQMMQKMGWKGSGLGSSEDGIVEPISGGEVRDRQEQFRGVGHGADPFEAFRKSKAGSFYTRMKERDKERDHGHRSSSGGPAK